MKTYQYKGYDAAGAVTRGFVEALSAKGAREKLASRGILAEKLNTTGIQRRFRIEARAVMYRELSSLLSAGVTLTRALEILMDSPDSANHAALLAGIRDRIREGGSLAVALRASSVSVSTYELAVIEAAEATASLAGMLGHVADFLEDRHRSEERIRSALIYPAFVGVTGIIVATVMLVFLVPKAETLLAHGNVELPFITSVAMALGRFSLNVGPALAGILLMAGIVVLSRYRSNNAFRIQCDRLRLQLPLIRRGGELLVNLRFCKTMSVLLEGGVNIVNAFPLASRSTGNAWIAALAESQIVALKGGAALSRVLMEIPPLKERVPSWVAVGEESGELSPLLTAAAKRLDDQWQRHITRSLGLLEPILILVIGAFVLFLTVAILLPVLSLSQSVG
ncbi:MAG: type II secretion system F family protein [Verrucomicrobia bacterium]|nr:type II secretion system F family protein [Verrucomicrobiota bacterium]